MAVTLTSLTSLDDLGFDAIIDVRAPSEYAEDHLPGAINLPVLSDAERAEVGTIYKQQSPFLARKIGAALVARNAARHLEGPLREMLGGWRPLVYCWRGGQRSGSFTTILQQVGWRAEVIAGGYKSWRTLVVDQVQSKPVAAPVVVLDGNTGTAKTEILAHLAGLGEQVIDLEGMANHRGSLFGRRPGGQPSQKWFEGQIAMALARLDPARPLFIEAESSRVGTLNVPKQLWAAMCAAPRVRISAALPVRAAYLARAYADLTQDGAALCDVIDLLRPLHAAERIEHWLSLAASRDHVALAEQLMRHHYDPRYNSHRARLTDGAEQLLEVASLDPDAVAAIADQVLAAANAKGFIRS